MPRFKLSEFLDKLVLLLSMLLFAWVGIRAIIGVKNLDTLSGSGRPLLSELKVNAPSYEAHGPTAVAESWAPPRSQKRGEDWLFDVFTPPVIYYDPSSREFAVTPPNLQPADTGLEKWSVFDIELLEVRLRPYRLQLVGYAGEPGSYVATFETAGTGQIVLLREGQEHSETGVRLLSFQEQQFEIEKEEDTPVLQNVGVARLQDFSSGQEVSLTNLETKMFSDLEARVRLLRDGAVRLVKMGSRLETESGDYIIEDLSAQPEEAMITKVSKDGTRRISKTLAPKPEPTLKPRSGRQESDPESPFAIRPHRSAAKPDR